MTRILQEAALDNSEAVLISTFRDAGLTVPRGLPVSWDEADAKERSVCLWYAHNILSYFDKAQVANHIVGCELLANQRAGRSPVMSKARADQIRAMVFSTPTKE